MKILRCGLCGCRPEGIDVYVELAEVEGLTADEYVWREEGTLDRATGVFLCDRCYIFAGMPSSPTGWTATPHNLAKVLVMRPSNMAFPPELEISTPDDDPAIMRHEAMTQALYRSAQREQARRVFEFVYQNDDLFRETLCTVANPDHLDYLELSLELLRLVDRATPKDEEGEDGLPVHLHMPIDAEGNGPADKEDAVVLVCWCSLSFDCPVLPPVEGELC